MARVRVLGKHEFEMLTPLDLTMDEVVELEVLLGVGMESWSTMMETKAMLFASARAHDPNMLTWAEVGALKAPDVVRLKDEEETDPPAEAGGEPEAE